MRAARALPGDEGREPNHAQHQTAHDRNLCRRPGQGARGYDLIRPTKPHRRALKPTTRNGPKLMTTTSLPTIAAWSALLALPPNGRQAFLDAAAAFVLASGAGPDQPARRPLARTPAGQRGPVPQGSAAPSTRLSAPPVAASATASRTASPEPKVVRPRRTMVARVMPTTVDGTATVPVLLRPLIGDRTLDMAASERFADPAYRHLWIPGSMSRVYVAGTPGLKALLQSFGLSGCYKVGTHAGEDVSRRMQDLNKQRYGSLWVDGEPVADPGFASWAAEPLPAGSIAPSPGSPVRLRALDLEVTRPVGMSAEAFDQALARALTGASLHGFAQSAAGEAYCTARGHDPRQLIRFSPNGKARPERATELILIRPRHGDAGRLLRLCEDLVYNHVMAHPHEAGRRVGSNGPAGRRLN